MGAGIAQVSAAAGCRTTVLEVNQGVLDKGLARMKKFLDDGVAKGKVAADVTRQDARESRRARPTYGDLADCDIVIEAIVENLDAKTEVYAALDAVVRPSTRSSARTRRRCPSPRWRRRRSARSASSACTSSTPCR